MTSRLLVVVSLVFTLALVACEQGPRGGAAESQLAAATTASDAAKIRTLLASGADPNKVVEVDGREQSAWFLALEQIRPRRPEHVEIVLAMLKAGASPKLAWGTDRTGPQESFWKKLSGPGRQAGSGGHDPLKIAMRNPVPEVVRTLIDAGADPANAASELAATVEAGDVVLVHLLVDAGVDVNTTAGEKTPLVAAIDARDVSMMTYLEEHGAREKP